MWILLKLLVRDCSWRSVQWKTYTSKQHTSQLNYNDNNIKASMYFNQADISANGPTYITSKGKKVFHNIIPKKEIVLTEPMCKKIGL